MAQPRIPAIKVAEDGYARVGTLVQLFQEGSLVKGSVTNFDIDKKQVIVKLEDGTEVTADACDVHRQFPHPPGAVQPPKPETCEKCKGTGKKESWMTFFRPSKDCNNCLGSGKVETPASYLSVRQLSNSDPDKVAAALEAAAAPEPRNNTAEEESN